MQTARCITPMYKRRCQGRIWAVLLVACASLGVSADTPNLGTPLETHEAPSIVVWPDGDGLPPGSGTPADGQVVYVEQCAACHGIEGQGGLNDALVSTQTTGQNSSGPRTVGSYWPYSTTLFDYVRRAMPYRAPGTLTNDETYAVVAYLLYRNEVISVDARLNAETLAQIKMPNHLSFYSTYELP